MIKKTNLIIIFLLPLWLTANSSLPTASLVEGKAFLVNLTSSEKKPLKTGDSIPVGYAVFTEAHSRVLLEFSDGVKKLIPAKSRFQILSTRQWEDYKKTTQSANKIFTLVGRKASNLSQKSAKREEIIQQINHQFANHQYLKTIDLIERNNIHLSHPNEVYAGAVSYLNLGLDGQSLALFQKLIEYDTYEYRELARYGAFICLIRLGKAEEAKKILQESRKQNQISHEMEDLLK